MAVLKEIFFENYKAFKTRHQISIKPITIIFGKNSSGKSSILKLISMLSNAVSHGAESEFSLTPKEYLSFGARYNDLFYNHILSDLNLGLIYEDKRVSAKMLINDGNFSIYIYEVQKGGHSIVIGLLDERPNSLYDSTCMTELGVQEKDMVFDVNYIGPIRIQAPYTISSASIKKRSDVGVRGEFSYEMLLNSYLKKDGLFEEVSAWFSKNMEGQELVMNDVNPSSGLYSLMVQRNGVQVNVADVGQGISQLLPIITESFIKYSRDTIVEIEQPALHLHPSAHATVAYRLAESSKETGTRYIIESHSENFLLGLRKMVVDKNVDFTADDVVIYYIHSEKSPFWIEEIHVSSDGTLTAWPTGVFDESFELMDQISDLQL